MKHYIVFCLLLLMSFGHLLAQTLPGISPITDRTVDEDAMPLTVSLLGITNNDPTEDQPLTINASSENSDLVTNITINYTSPNSFGDLILTLGANANGSSLITVSVSDVDGPTETSFLLTVNPINDPPGFSTLPVTTATQDVLYTYTMEASDPDNDNLSFSSTTSPSWLSFTDNNNNTATLQGTPTNADVGNHDISIQVSDDELLVTIQTFIISVNDVNDGPIALDGSYSTAENQTIEIPIYDLVSDADNNLDYTTLIVTSAPSNGTTTVNPTTQSITYIPSTDVTGSDQFTYSISDQDGASDSGIITIQIQGQRPIAVVDNFSLNEDVVSVLRPLANDTDPQNNIDPGSLALLTNPTHGSINTDEYGVFTYTPNPNYFGDDQMSYRICDETGYCAEAVINLTILPVNDVPVPAPDVASTLEDSAVDIDVLANDLDPNDPDGGINTASILIVQPPSNGTVSINSVGVITYTPRDDFNGQDTFIYSIADNGIPAPALRGQASVTVNIVAVNDAPEALDNQIFTAQETPTNVDILSNDNDNRDPLGGIDATSLQIIQQPQNGSIIILPNNEINYDPFLNFFGRDTARYVVADLGHPLPALTDTAWIFLEVTRRSPTAVDDIARTNEDTPVNINVLSNDLDTDINPGTVTIQSFPENGSVTVGTSGVFSYTPALNFFGNDQFTYTVRDRTDLISNTATVNIEVAPVADAPVTRDAGYTTREDTPITISLVDLVSDAENNQDYSTLQIIMISHFGTVEQTSELTSLIYRPLAGFTGTATIRYQLSDDGGLESNFSTITIIVSNEAPTAMNDTAETTEDTPVTIDILDNDTDPQNNLDPTSVTIISQPTNGLASINTSNGSITYTPAANFHGNDQLIYRVCDDDGYCDEALIDLTVEPVNDAPTPVNDAFQTNEDTQLFMDILNNDQDIDNVMSTLTLTLVSAPTHGTLIEEADPRGFNYQPEANYYGSDSFIYRLSDPEGASGEATVTIEILSINDAPYAVDDNYNQIGTAGAWLPVLENDTDPENQIEASTLSVSEGPGNGTINVNQESGEIFYQPNASFFGVDAFTYRICDTQGACATAQVTLQVIAGNTAPVAISDTMSVMDGTSETIWVAQNDTDAEGQNLTYTLLTNTQTLYGTIQLDAAGSLTYQAISDMYCNTDILEYSVCDPLGMCDTALVVVHIIPADLNGNGIPYILEGDQDGDNIPDSIEAGTFDICNGNFRDTDNDGTYDYLDNDSDGDGQSDLEEGIDDCDNDGIPNYMDAFDDCGDRLRVPSTFSPNGDGRNDEWVIQGISAFADNELFVYNRWGGLVYHKKGYNNTWNGLSDSSTLGSSQLPEGTYFYVLKLGNKIEKGTVFIKR